MTRALRRAQRAVDAVEGVQLAHALAAGAQAQFGRIVGMAHQAEEAALLVAVVGVVVRVAVDAGGDPEALAQGGDVVGVPVGRRLHAGGEGRLQHTLGAGDVRLGGGRDARRGLAQQLAREFVHRVAAGVVRQAADHQRHRQHHQHVGQGEQLAQ